MKTKSESKPFLKLILPLLLALTGCASENDRTVTASYGYVNGVCYDQSAGTQVSSTYCSGSSLTYNTYFTWNGTTCTNTRTNQVVNTNYCGSSPFSYSGTSCYDKIAGTTVESTYCGYIASSTTTSTYSLSNGVCYLTSTGAVVNGTYCGVTSTTSVSTAGQCLGVYYYAYYGYMAPVTCYGANCRGYMLYSAAGQVVTCQ